MSPEVGAQPTGSGADRLRAYVRSAVLPMVEEWEAEGRVPVEVYRELCRSDMLVRAVSADFSPSAELEVLADALVGVRSLGTTFTVLAGFLQPRALLQALEGEGIARPAWADTLGQGRLVATAFADWLWAVGRREAPSAVTAVRRGSSLYLRGTCAPVLNLPHADDLILAASCEGRPCLVRLPLHTSPRGLVVGRVNTTGLRTAALGRVRLDDCAVDLECVVVNGRVTRSAFLRALALTRLVFSRTLLTYARTAFHSTLQWAAERQLGARSLSHMQVVRHRVADLLAAYEIAAAFLEEATRRSGADPVAWHDAALLAQMNAVTSAQHLSAWSVQFLGGRGFLNEYWVSGAYRDCLDPLPYLGAYQEIRSYLAEALPEVSL